MDRMHLSNHRFHVALALKGGAVEEFAAKTPAGSVPIFFRGAESRLPVCFPLVPFGNRLRGNNFTFEGRLYHLAANTAGDPLYLHGDGWLGDWTLERASSTEAVLAFDHTGDHFAYAYRAEQRFRLEDDTFRIRLSATNTGAQRMPFGLGLHPFLPLTPLTEISFEAERFWEQDEAFLPTRCLPVSGELNFAQFKPLPRRWMNTEFEGWSGHALIRWPETGAELTIVTEPVVSHCMIFVSSPDFDTGYQRDWFCFEPMSHGVDAHHRQEGGLTPLDPGATMAIEVSFEFRLPL